MVVKNRDEKIDTTEIQLCIVRLKRWQTCAYVVRVEGNKATNLIARLPAKIT